jgi:hypothetical protein
MAVLFVQGVLLGGTSVTFRVHRNSTIEILYIRKKRGRGKILLLCSLVINRYKRDVLLATGPSSVDGYRSNVFKPKVVDYVK